MPGSGEPAEVIEPNHINKSEKRSKKIDAPAIAALPQGFPVIDGVPPKLSVRAEIIRRHAGHEDRTAILVEEKELWIGPDITRVGRNKKRHVADQAHTF